VEGAGLEQSASSGPGASGVGIVFTQNTTMNTQDVKVSGFSTGMSVSGRPGSSIRASRIHHNDNGLVLNYGSGVFLAAGSSIGNNSNQSAQVIQGSSIEVQGGSIIIDRALFPLEPMLPDVPDISHNGHTD
jgi:hypothetical protein